MRGKTTKRARPAETYRAARRARARADRAKWPGVEATSRPYLIKPPQLKMGPDGPYTNLRDQPKTYKPNGKRECARRRHELWREHDPVAGPP